MLTHVSHKPHRHHSEDADDPEPGMLPVEPDEGPIQPVIPADAEHERIVDPEV
jgi:hypothetical protein